jgi:hypothetical protein
LAADPVIVFGFFWAEVVEAIASSRKIARSR